LLHEIAHEVGAAKFQNDFGNSSAGKNNDKLVDHYCGSEIRNLQ
jgi:hypothetical protein